MSGSSKDKGHNFEGRTTNITVPIVLNKSICLLNQNLLLSLISPLLTKVATVQITEVPLRSQRIRKPTISNDYVYSNKSDFKIDQSNDSNSFDEVVSCFFRVTAGLQICKSS